MCVVTSGPGATNAITGLAGAWLDATPVIFLSGQAKRSDLVNGQGIRQFGIQEIGIVDIVKSITKYAVQVRDAEDILYELEKATALAKEGKPGPVWLDIPLDIQASKVNVETLRHYNGKIPAYECKDEDILKSIVGIGVAAFLGSNGDITRKLAEQRGAPVAVAWKWSAFSKSHSRDERFD